MKRTLIFILLLSTSIFYSYERFVDFDLIKTPGPPRVVENGILFTLAGKENENIFIRTDLDNWTEDHYYKTNLYGVKYVYLKFDYTTTVIKYRININGYWEEDINNANYEEDLFGTKLFVINLSPENKFYNKLPIVEKTDNKIKTVIFKYYNPEASEVNFVNSADNFSEYTYPMTKDQYGWWTIKKSFTRGKYWYYFLANGKKVNDINNINKEWDEKKGILSFFVID
jgi:hypothetical protein